MMIRTRIRRAERRGWTVVRIDEPNARWAAVKGKDALFADTRPALMDKVEAKEEKSND